MRRAKKLSVWWQMQNRANFLLFGVIAALELRFEDIAIPWQGLNSNRNEQMIKLRTPDKLSCSAYLPDIPVTLRAG